jgi:hypothetical protein
MQIHYALIGYQPIIDLLIYIVREINKLIDLLYPNTFPPTIRYLWADYNNRKSTVTFTSWSLVQFNPVIVFGGDALKFFNLGQDNSQLIALAYNQTIVIAFNSNNGY